MSQQRMPASAQKQDKPILNRADELKPLAPGEIPDLMYVASMNSVVVKCSSQQEGRARLKASLGITSEHFFEGTLNQLVNATSEGSTVDEDKLNFAVSLVQSIGPRDQLETMLAIQMATVHLSSMRFARKMNQADTIQRLDLQERVVNKLMRTFTSQMEALRKHRNGGNQRVTVKHVHVHEGGQAIVGNVSHGGRSITEGSMQSHEQESLPLSVRAALHGHLEEDEVPMSGTC